MTSRLPARVHAAFPTLHPRRRLLAGMAASLALLLAPSVCHALPSFARQMDTQCITCHTEFPILNAFGRSFKLSGYTGEADTATSLPPIAVMLMPSFTHTQKSQDGGAAPGFSANDNFAVTQASVFYAGRLFGPWSDKLFGKDSWADKLGLFSQTTYDGVGKAWSWDNTELRYADTAAMGDNEVKWGVYANNNPMMQDLWHDTTAWGFPFSGSGLAPTPAAATLIDGGLAQQVAGVGAYGYFADTLYVDVGAYHTLGAHLQKQLGVDPSDEAQVSGLAPYLRVAVDRMIGEAHWEFGTFGMAASTYPGRDPSAGQDRTLDLGLDTQYQVSAGVHDVTATLSYIYERQHWDASSGLGGTANPTDNLRSFKATVDYLYDKTYGGMVQYFQLSGSEDTGLYADSPTGSPTSDGLILQVNYLPFNKSGGPAVWPRSNVKLSAQYVMYNRFDGGRDNFDGNGANARDNNTLYLEAWIAF